VVHLVARVLMLLVWAAGQRRTQRAEAADGGANEGESVAAGAEVEVVRLVNGLVGERGRAQQCSEC